MAEFQVRSDTVDVEHIMRQIRQRIAEKRGVDYTEEELKALAAVKLEKFLDPAGVRSDLVEQFKAAHVPPPDPPGRLEPSFTFEDTTLYETHRGALRFLRRLFRPLLKMLFNPDPIVHALHIQANLNQRNWEFQTSTMARQHALDTLRYEVIHNLVIELTRMGIEVRNLRMRLDAVVGRLDFDERRQRAFEGVVQYRKPDGRPHAGRGPGGRPQEGAAAGPQAAAPGSPDGAAPAVPAEGEDALQRSRRRRRRRRRVPPAGMPAPGGGAPAGAAPDGGESGGGEGSAE